MHFKGKIYCFSIWVHEAQQHWNDYFPLSPSPFLTKLRPQSRKVQLELAIARSVFTFKHLRMPVYLYITDFTIFRHA